MGDLSIVAEDYQRAWLAARERELPSGQRSRGARDQPDEDPDSVPALETRLRQPTASLGRTSPVMYREGSTLRSARASGWAAAKRSNFQTVWNCQSTCAYELLEPTLTIDPEWARMGRNNANIFITHPTAQDYAKTAWVEVGEAGWPGPAASRRIVGFETTFTLPGTTAGVGAGTHLVSVHSRFEAWHRYELYSLGKASYGEFRTASLLAVHVTVPNDDIVDGYTAVMSAEAPRGNWKKNRMEIKAGLEARGAEHEVDFAVHAAQIPTSVRVQELFVAEALRHHRVDRCSAWVSCGVHFEPLAVVTVTTCPTINLVQQPASERDLHQ